MLHINIGINEGKESRDESETSHLILRCPCGQCSLESYLDEDCPESKSGSFPYLTLSPELDEDTRLDLFSILEAGTDRMIQSFADLLDKIRTSLNTRGIDTLEVVNRALTLFATPKLQKPLLKEDEKELRSCTSINEAFLILQPYTSFFNIELLKHITDSKKICTDEDRREMKEYCSELEKFCRRRVFEVPPGIFGQSTSKLSKKKRKTFAVLITDHPEQPTIQYATATRVKIASLLKLLPSTLHLHRIDPGSVILVFSVPTFVAKKLFPLKQSMKATLKAEGLHLFPPKIEDTPWKGTCIFDLNEN